MFHKLFSELAERVSRLRTEFEPDGRPFTSLMDKNEGSGGPAFKLPSRREARPSDDNPEPTRRYTATVEDIPVFLPLSKVAPHCDPAEWGRFVSIETSDIHKDKVWATGWKGTLTETLSSRFVHDIGELAGLQIGEFRNVLRIDPYEYDDRRSIVRFRLERALVGRLRVDEGYCKATATELRDLTVFSAKKTLAFEPDSPWCRPALAWLVQPMLEYTLLTWNVEYALRLMAHVLTEEGSAADRRLLAYGTRYYDKLLKGKHPAEQIKADAPNLLDEAKAALGGRPPENGGR